MILTQESAIQFEHIFVTRNNQVILKDISGLIPKGKITTFVGPSGAGKTTLLKLCNRLISQTSGSIFIDNLNIETYDVIKLRQEIGIALQAATMIKGSVYDNLNLPKKLQNLNLSIKDANSILYDVGLDETFLKKDAKNLSGGEKQRISIARTLINNSKILLLDEITSALDPKSVKEIEQLIIRLNKKYKVTIIWITHNLKQAMALGDAMWLLVDGQLIEAGTPTALKQSKKPLVQQFLRGELNDL